MAPNSNLKLGLPIPNELILDILEQLPKKDLWSFAKTSKLAYQFCKETLLYRVVQYGLRSLSHPEFSHIYGVPSVKLKANPFAWISSMEHVRGRSLYLREDLDAVENYSIAPWIKCLELVLNPPYWTMNHPPNSRFVVELLPCLTAAHTLVLDITYCRITWRILENQLEILRTHLKHNIHTLGVRANLGCFSEVDKHGHGVEHFDVSIPAHVVTVKLELLRGTRYKWRSLAAGVEPSMTSPIIESMLPSSVTQNLCNLSIIL